MLQLYDLSHVKLHGLTNYKDLKRERLLNGDEVLSFSYPQNDDKYQDIKEETYIRTKDNEYVIKEVNIEDDWTEFVCKINVENLKGTIFPHFESVESSCTDAINLALAGTGWTIASCDVTKLRTVRKSNCSSYDILQEIRKVYRCDFRFDALNKKVYIFQSMGSDKGAYFSEELNLKRLGVQSNSYDYCTRIIPIGKDGLRINDVNNGKEYVENYQYSSKVIAIYWEDNRYTVAQSLKDDAEARLNELSKPIKAYKADIYDLARLNDKYKNILDYDLGDTITLLSKDKKVKDKQRIVKILEYLEEPERNTCEIANRVMSLEDLQTEFIEATETVNAVTTSDGQLDGTKIDSVDGGIIKNLKVMTADIQDLNVVTARIGNLEVTSATITMLNTQIARIDDLKATSATITQLNAATGRITTLESKAASIDTLLAGNLSATNMQAGFITATSGLIANGAISDAMIQNLSVSKVLAGDISTTKFRIVSDAGNMLISDNTIQIKDASRVRVQIGKDASNDYNMYVWDASGNLMFDATGLKASGIKDKIIRDDMVSDTANINGSKIEKESLVTQINGATTLLKASNVKLDTEAQTLDVAFTSLKNTVTSQGSTITSQGTSISTIQGQISSKIWSSDITTSINGSVYGRNSIINGDFESGTTNWNTNFVLDTSIYKFGAKSLKYINNGSSIGSLYQTVSGSSGDKYYFSAWVYLQSNSGGSSNAMYISASNLAQTVGLGGAYCSPSIIGSWQKLSCVVTGYTGNAGIYFRMYSYNNACTVNVDGIVVINLTALFGAGKEPSKTWCDDNIAFDTLAKNVQGQLDNANSNITTINNNYSSLNQTVNSISANVSSLQTTTSNLGTRMTSAESSITALNNSIVLKVTQTDINNSINAIQIGGRNLFVFKAWSAGLTSTRGSISNLTDKSFTMTSSSADCFTNTYSGTAVIGFNVTPSTQYILNFKKANNTSGICYIFYCPNSSVTYNSSVTTNGTSISFTTPSDCNYIRIRFGIDASGLTETFSEIKLEKGNKATEWTPAPEDVQGQIDTTNSNLTSVTTRVTTAESNITQLSNGITLKVSTTDFNSYKTSNDGAVSSLTSRMSAAELKITSDAIVSTVRTSTAYTNDLSAKANVTDVNSQITQLSNSITSKVSIGDLGTLITQNASSVKVAVGQIGGNNFVKNSSFEFDTDLGTTSDGTEFNTAAIVSNGHWSGLNATNGTRFYFMYSLTAGDHYVRYTNMKITVTPGKKYTISFDYAFSGSITGDSVWWYMSDGNPFHIPISGNDFHIDQKWHRISFVWTCPSNITWIYPRFGYTSNGSAWAGWDSIKVEEGENATAWSPNANELKSASFEVTDQHARFTSSDGSYTEFTPSTTGLKWHKVAGDAGKDYHYLAEVGTGTSYSGLENITIPLPSEFKNKKFKVIAMLSNIQGQTNYEALNRLWVSIPDNLIDFANATFVVSVDALAINVDTKEFLRRAVTFSWLAIA